MKAIALLLAISAIVWFMNRPSEWDRSVAETAAARDACHERFSNENQKAALDRCLEPIIKRMRGTP